MEKKVGPRNKAEGVIMKWSLALLDDMSQDTDVIAGIGAAMLGFIGIANGWLHRHDDQ